MIDSVPLPPLRRPLAVLAAVALLSGLGGLALGRSGTEQRAALLGVGASAFVGVLGLLLKRRALSRGIRYGLWVTGVNFVVRLLLLMVGAVWVRSQGGGVTPFVVGFLVVFGALQWVEVGYVAWAAKRR
jgi:hypothetical protein